MMDAKKQKFSFNKIEWNKLNGIIIENPFNPYCYSNVDELVKQWYKWLEEILTKNIPKTTKHRARLPAWVKNETSHLMKTIMNLKKSLVKKSNLSNNTKT